MSQNDQLVPHSIEKPGLIQGLAIMTLINGILNLIWSVLVAIFLAATFLGIICIPLAGYPLALGILEIIYAARLLSTPTRNLRPAKHLAVMEICNVLYANALSLVVGILALVFYDDALVKAFFQELEQPA
jgi:hypothetical protein